MINTTVMTGFMELTPSQQLEFDRIKQVIQDEYSRFGFTPIDTPVLERSEALLAKAGGETEKQIYRFTKGETDISMRFDLTVPLARYVADHYGSLVFPFRRSHIAKVYRGERPQRGRYREFYQCDIDVIGEDTLDVAYEAEIPRVIYSIFSRLNLGAFTIKLNNRKVLSGLMAHLDAQAVSAEILRVIDKVEKISPEAFTNELLALGLGESQVQDIIRFIGIKADADTVVAELRAMGISNEQFTQGVSQLEAVVRLMRAMGVPDEYFAIDLSIARGLDYYTGTVYETALNNYPQIGSICSGGRYDDLATHYTKKRLPGVGISIGLTRLFGQLVELGLVSDSRRTVADALVIPITDDELTAACDVSMQLRRAGCNVDTLLVSTAVKKKFKYADRLGIPQVVIVGQEEVQTGMYTMQDMQSGNKTQGSTEALAELLIASKNNKSAL